MARVIADFGPRGQAIVDDEDFEALRNYRYRMLTQGDVVRSLPRHPDDRLSKANWYLQRDVALLMGLPSGRAIGFRDGDHLNCRRENLFAQDRLPRPGARANTVRHIQPEGLHRKRIYQPAEGRSFSPAAGYFIFWHEGPCTKDIAGTCAGNDAETRAFIGSAHRLPGRVPSGWRMKDLDGTRQEFALYHDGAVWLVQRYLNRAVSDSDVCAGYGYEEVAALCPW